MAQQSSRLHRLLTLLDTGSTQATRFTAARQIGDIAKSLPLELGALLKKVSQYLRSRNWDTRVAAAHAIGAIAENVKHTTLKEVLSFVEAKVLENGPSDVAEGITSVWSDFHPDDLGALSFSRLDINRVLQFGGLLVSSGGQEYDVVDTGKNPTERLARQRKNLRRRLGMDGCEQFMDLNDMIRDEDLILQKGYPQENGSNHSYYASGSAHSQNVRQLVANMVPSFRPKRLSTRELNLLKRKAKLNAKEQSKGWSEDEDLAGVTSQNNLKETFSEESTTKQVAADASMEDNYDNNDDGGWPFGKFVEQLVHDIFDPIWEIRHGALMALREILSRQGASVGVIMPDVMPERIWPEVNTQHAHSHKRVREIDLNDHVALDEAEPDLKRGKHIHDTVMPDHALQCTNLSVCSDDIVDRKEFTQLTTTVVEGVHSVTLEGRVDQGTSDVKLEPILAVKSEDSVEDVLNDDNKSGMFSDGSESVSTSLYSEHGGPPNISTLSNIPENAKLKKLIYLARKSWVRNWEILQDCAIRFLCVLSLDRFGDFISDQVVAPVRETCSQALGAVLKNMHPSLVRETLNVLLHMQRRQEWEVRHGSLLGMKYMVAVRQDLLKDLLVFILPACKAGLDDADDDVRAVAAEALIPAASCLASLNGESLNSIVMLLWDILLDLDDLSPSTSSVMNLLAEIYSQPEIVPHMLASLTPAELQDFDLNQLSRHDGLGKQIKDENPYILSFLTPRLWPFMRHSIASVRHSAIRTMERLLEICYKKFSPIEVSALWSKSILGDTLRIVFQNLLLEPVEEILQCSERVWRLLVQCPGLEFAASAYFSSWLELATTPSGVALDTSKMLCPAVLPRKSHVKAAAKMQAAKLENDFQRNHPVNISRESTLLASREDSNNLSRMVVGSDNDKSVTCMRVVTATALGIFAAKLPDDHLHVVIDALRSNLSSLYGLRRQVAAVVLIAWCKEIRSGKSSGRIGVSGLLGSIRQWILELLTCTDPCFPTKNSRLPYAELSRTYKKMRIEATSLLHLANSSGLFTKYIADANINIDSLSSDAALSFASKMSCLSERLDAISSNEQHIVDEIESTKQQLLSTAGYLTHLQNNLHVAVSSLLAASVVWMSDLPEKLNPIVLPLMASIKREKEEILQEKAAEGLAELVFSCVGRKPNPNDKIIKNICSLTCMDQSVTPLASVVTSIEVIEDQDLLSLGVSTNYKLKNQVSDSAETRSKLDGCISRRGAELALKYMCRSFGPSLFEKLPRLWDCLTEVIRPLKSEGQSTTDDRELQLMIDNHTDAQSLINNLHVVRTIASVVDNSLEAKVLSLLPSIIFCVRHFHAAVRLAASICITSMAKTMTGSIMKSVIEKVIPMLQDSTSVDARQGAGMLFCLLVQGLGIDLVPYAPLLVVPLLRCLSDSDRTVRQTVTRSFAVLVPLLPLARGVKMPIVLSESSSSNTEDSEFLEQLLDNSHIDDYKLPVKLKIELRRYQHEGINWLSFLRRFKLHGILCDDMGLGKTLQASAIVASDIAERRNATTGLHTMSLIICPSTLVGHWAYEIDKYIGDSVVTTLQYIGSAQDRILLRKTFGNYNVVIASYDVVRKDIDFLGKISWNYCVLDEGHIIKNSKSKITTSVKQLQAEHRLILSGTPIQNNVLELWSLFDFLMPGFLGTERQFQATYGKPLLAAKDSKCSAKEAEAGVLAMEALHKQVMPFILRRTKDEVLSDLPEKIIQDRYCDLSSIQLRLYEQFSSSGVKREVSDIVRVTEGDHATEALKPGIGTSHVFQALKYLLKLCSHPLLVLGPKPPTTLMHLLAEEFPGSSDIPKELQEVQHSPKLVALQEILEECGIGLNAPGAESTVAVGQHRVLIFAQHRALLDIIERDLFQAHMKSVTYLRLDGSVEPARRFEIVKSFNSDPTIDVLLLTTHVGGLGLNLTSADTVVFMEHDWNPMKDLQAMDRAHRLGQRKVVNVHRLIMRGTLEEKVMSLQRFKVSVANAVINAENASLKTMNTDELLDLFTSAKSTRKSPSSLITPGEISTADGQQASGKKGLKAMLNGLEELWDQSQYSEEYNLNQFLAKLDG